LSPGRRANLASRGTGRRQKEPISPTQFDSIKKIGLTLHQAKGPTANGEKNESVRSRP